MAALEALESRVHLSGTAPVPSPARRAAGSAVASVAVRQAPAATPLGHTAARLSQAREDFTIATVGSQVLFAGGAYTDANGNTVASDVVDVFDTATGRWAAAKLAHAGRPASAVVGSRVIFAVGTTASIYDATTGRWSTATLTHAHDYATGVTVVGDRAIFAGGDAASGASDAVDIYDAATGRWSAARLAEARRGVAAVTIGGKAIFAGGYTGDAQTYIGSRTVDVYDAATGRWTTAADLSTAGGRWVRRVGNKAVFQSESALDLYDAATGRWSATTLPRSHYGPAVAVAGPKLVFAGGYADGTAFTDVYDTVTGRWTSGNLPVPRWGIASATVGGTAIFAGGDTDDGLQATNAVDLYDAATSRWSTAKLSLAREGLAVATLGTRAFFAGGFEPIPDGESNVLDVYDAATGLWSTATLAQPRQDLAAVTLNGRVLFAGGLTPSGPSDVVDIFTPGATAIPVPADLRPAPGAALATAPRTLNWSPAPGATSYNVYLDDSFVRNVTSNHWTVDRTIATGAHTWQVVARNGAVATGAPRLNFTVGAPALPANPAPAPAAALATPPTELSWKPSPGATSYDVFLDGALVQNVAANRCTLAHPVIGGRHAWQVVARNGFAATPGPTWTFTTPVAPLTRKPTTRPHAGTDKSPVTIGGRVIYAGGRLDSNTQSDDADIFDPATGQWSAGTLSQARDGAVTATAGDQALFAGGTFTIRGSYYDYSTAVDLYNARSRTWSTGALSLARGQITAASVGSKALFAGGEHGRTTGEPGWVDERTVDIYDANEDRWSTAMLSQGRSSLTVAVVGDQALFAGGTFHGDDPYYPTASDVVDLYDATTGRWSAAKLSQARNYMAATTVGTLALFAGGFAYPGGGYTDAVDVYDAATGQWSTARLSQPRSHVTAITVGHLAIFAGGAVSSGDASDVVDIFDAATGRWSTARLSQGRVAGSATALGTKAIFAGGGGGDTIDVFDTATGTWSVAALSQGGNLSPATVGTRAVFAGGGANGDAADVFTDTAPAPAFDGAIADLDDSAVAVTLRNTGDAPLAAPFTLAVYGRTPRGGSVLLGTVSSAKTLRHGATRRFTIPLSLPDGAVIRDYELTAAVDAAGGQTSFAARLDATPPAAALAPAPTLRDSLATYAFTVTYHDLNRIDTSTIDDDDILVTGPNGFAKHARLVSVTRGRQGSTRIATYTIRGDGLRWDPTDNGTYEIHLQDEQVTDAAGNAAVGREIGTFAVAIPQTAIAIQSPAPLTRAVKFPKRERPFDD